jgi:hypothetical protein
MRQIRERLNCVRIQFEEFLMLDPEVIRGLLEFPPFRVPIAKQFSVGSQFQLCF